MAKYVASDGSPKLCVIMVGLPARGKSLMAQKVVRYLNWQSVKAKSFNVGTFRRQVAGNPSADFFRFDHPEGQKLRLEAAQLALKELLAWIAEPDSVVAVYDATNSSRTRRSWLNEELSSRGIRPLFVETLCDNEEVIMQNVMDVKTTSPDYKDQNEQEAVKDFMNRITQYSKHYETMHTSENVTFIKIIDIGAQVVVNSIRSYLESHIVYYLMNLHTKPRRLYLSRHGESEYNLTGQLGGDANISPRGELYARKLPELVANAVGNQSLTVWTSTLKRTSQTARFLPYPKIQWKALDELDAGVCDGLTYEDIKNQYPEDFAARDENKYEYRYRGGESYRDVVTRLDPIIMELERQENIMIVTHQAVLRCIYAYFMNVPQEKSPWMEVPLHTLICLEPRAYGTVETRISADIPAVSTFRAKGEIPKNPTAEDVEEQRNSVSV